MKITFTFVNGTDFVLWQRDPVRCHHICEQLTRPSLFNQEFKPLCGPMGIGGVAMEHVESLTFEEFDGIAIPAIAGLEGNKVMNAAEFDTILQQDGERLVDQRETIRPGQEITHYVSCTMTSGKNHYLRMQNALRSHIDQIIRLKKLALASTIAARFDGGILLLNPGQILMFQACPGAPNVSPEAWYFQEQG